MKKIYIASALGNYQEVLRLQKRLRENHKIDVTFDWAAEYEAQLKNGTMASLGYKTVLAAQMEDAVRAAKAMLLVLPAKRGAHIEFGIARGCRKPVVVLCANPLDDISFYHLPGVRLIRDSAWVPFYLKRAMESRRE